MTRALDHILDIFMRAEIYQFVRMLPAYSVPFILAFLIYRSLKKGR